MLYLIKTAILNLSNQELITPNRDQLLCSKMDQLAPSLQYQQVKIKLNLSHSCNKVISEVGQCKENLGILLWEMLILL
jgi:hypothetical protein